MPLSKLSPAPRTMLKAGQPVVDHWHHLDDEAPLPATGDIVVSPARLDAQAGDLATRRAAGHRVGLRLTTEDTAETAAAHLDAVDLVAIYIPKFVDGRFFTIARLLRERHGYTGELRACGDVVPDQVFYMHRCGFDAYEVPGPEHRLLAAAKALATFTVAYQGGSLRAQRGQATSGKVAQAS